MLGPNFSECYVRINDILSNKELKNTLVFACHGPEIPLEYWRSRTFVQGASKFRKRREMTSYICNWTHPLYNSNKYWYYLLGLITCIVSSNFLYTFVERCRAQNQNFSTHLWFHTFSQLPKRFPSFILRLSFVFACKIFVLMNLCLDMPMNCIQHYIWSKDYDTYWDKFYVICITFILCK